MKICISIRKTETGWYTAVCPQLPGCLSRGQTCAEAVVRIEDAIRGYFAAVGDFVPENVEHELVGAEVGQASSES